jgi:hypothetical protein
LLLAPESRKKVCEGVYPKFSKQLTMAGKFISISFLKRDDREAYAALLQERATRTGLVRPS